MYRSPLRKQLEEPFGYAPRDPVVTPTVAAYAAVAAATVAAAGAIRSGQAQNKIAGYNAAVLEEQARATRAAAAAEETKQRIRADQLAGKQRVAAAASGVDVSGSPLLAMADSASQAEQDAIAIRNSGDMNALRLTSQAALARLQGQEAKTASYFTATSSLLSGASRYASIKNGLGDKGTEVT